jgi:hypothetical protein
VREARKLAAILVADVVGYSRLSGADEDRTLSWLRAAPEGPDRPRRQCATPCVHREVKQAAELGARGSNTSEERNYALGNSTEEA